MLQQWKVKENINYRDVFRKGTVGLIITFIAGLLFGKENMMIAFVIVLGANIYEKENLRVKTVQKILRLLVRDVVIVCMAFIASQNMWWGIPFNLIAIFIIIFSLVSPYDQISYKTFMMLYVFCQYSYITLSELPSRLFLVVFAMGCVLISSLVYQLRNKALLDSNIGKGWKMIDEQLHNILEGRFDHTLSIACRTAMNEVAHTIYRTGYRRYFTTQQGKIQFHFYMNISYFNVLLESIDREYARGEFGKRQLLALISITETINRYFKYEIKRDEIIQVLKNAVELGLIHYGFGAEVMEILEALYKNFVELDEMDYKKKNTVYGEWERTSLNQLYDDFQNALNPKSMRVNFAVRLAIILTITLLLAHQLGFYKIIWAIIPIMSTTRPYYEDTMQRKSDRVKSNLLACLIVGVIINIVDIEWISALLVVLGFYGVYTFKDYYRMSFFLTVISMCLSSFGTGINSLIFYRLIYLLVGIGIVELSARVKPFKLKDGINELVEKIDRLNTKLESEALRSLKHEENTHIIRETIIHSALLGQHLSIHNKAYKDEKITKLVEDNAEFVIRLGHQLLTQSESRR